MVLLTWTLCLLHGEPPVSVLTLHSRLLTPQMVVFHGPFCAAAAGNQVLSVPAPFVWPEATQPGEQLHCPAGCVQPQLP